MPAPCREKRRSQTSATMNHQFFNRLLAILMSSRKGRQETCVENIARPPGLVVTHIFGSGRRVPRAMPVFRLPEACGLKTNSMLQQLDVTNKLVQARPILQAFGDENHCIAWDGSTSEPTNYLPNYTGRASGTRPHRVRVWLTVITSLRSLSQSAI